MWPEILVLINDADWELLGELDYQLQDRDSTLHLHAAGWLRAPRYASMPGPSWNGQNRTIGYPLGPYFQIYLSPLATFFPTLSSGLPPGREKRPGVKNEPFSGTWAGERGQEGRHLSWTLLLLAVEVGESVPQRSRKWRGSVQPGDPATVPLCVSLSDCLTRHCNSWAEVPSWERWMNLSSWWQAPPLSKIGGVSTSVSPSG